MNMQATLEYPVSKQRIGKYKTGTLLETIFSIRSVQSGYKEEYSWEQLVESWALRR
jgi:hypothetical protein